MKTLNIFGLLLAVTALIFSCSIETATNGSESGDSGSSSIVTSNNNIDLYENTTETKNVTAAVGETA